ncbi:MAG: GTP-binding protein [Verrucomicrobium sp.]|nr:GTP-binding protein [Verrucomicrobium sp.]
MNPMRRLSLTLLTGFLGSGKTSLMQHVLSQPEFPRQETVVLVNDFGKVNVDAALLAAKVSRLTALTAGCLCCASYPELGRNLERLAADPSVKHVWIEASGVAETDDLLDRLTEAPLWNRMELAQVIHVVDGSNYPGWWLNRSLAREQLRWADLVVVNKADQAKPASLEKIAEDLARHNPRAVRADVTRGRVDPELVLGARRSAVPRHRATSGAAPHPEKTSTVFLSLERPVPRPVLERALREAPGEIYRAKGLVRFDDAPDSPCVFQKAGDQTDAVAWSAPAELAELPCGLVLLGRGLDEAALAAHFAGLGAVSA